jgi:hypothetical protein
MRSNLVINQLLSCLGMKIGEPDGAELLNRGLYLFLKLFRPEFLQVINYNMVNLQNSMLKFYDKLPGISVK